MGRAGDDLTLEDRGFDLLARVETQLSAVPPRGVVLELKTLEGEPFLWYSRVVRLFLSTGILLKEGFPSEAVILIRSMVEASLRLEYLASVDERERSALILGAINEALNDFEHLEAEYVRQDPEAPRLREVAELLQERRGLVQKKQRQLGLGRLQSFPSEKQLAKGLGRLDEYLDFEAAHQHVHGGHLAQRIGSKRLPDDVMGVPLRDRDVAKVVGFGAAAAKSALRAQRAMCAIAGWEAVDIDDLLKVCDEVDATASA